MKSGSTTRIVSLRGSGAELRIDAARTLGFAGLAPFFAAAAGALFGPPDFAATAGRALTLYGALILSFMGGCRWGFAAAGLGDRPARDYLVAVAPALFAFALLLAAEVWPGALGQGGVALGLAVGFVLLYFSDRAAASRAAAPVWWPRLRLPLTLGAAASLAAGSLGAA